MIRIDLHTHSFGSPDGGLTVGQYKRMLQSNRLDYIAITDHNTIRIAAQIKKRLGECIIIGEEISTTEGDLIGLYLTEEIPAGLSARETATRIKAQGGIVYMPHPFEHVRRGLGMDILKSLETSTDVIEVYNGRAITQLGNRKALAWATQRAIPGAASSDAHGWYGWGKTYTLISEAPTPETLCKLLGTGKIKASLPGVRTVLYPTLHRWRKRLKNERVERPSI